ncbi:hypothetical protein F5Y15DRAFT_291636 [Xylariaceae sp. FL0016]|nr:hypothetical protein F5Y15DRAFT_291636 [Xylariaceae sp. FL0016]
MEPPSKRLRLSHAPYESDDEPYQDELSLTATQFAQRQDPLYHLDKGRAKAATRLKCAFESIFEKYEKDFTGVGDEIDLATGEVIIDNGHLKSLEDHEDLTRENSVDRNEEERIVRGKPEHESHPKSLSPRGSSTNNRISCGLSAGMGNTHHAPPLAFEQDPFGPSNSFTPFDAPFLGNKSLDTSWQAPELPIQTMQNLRSFHDLPLGHASAYHFNDIPVMSSGGNPYGVMSRLSHRQGFRRVTNARSLAPGPLHSPDQAQSDTEEDDILLNRKDGDSVEADKKKSNKSARFGALIPADTARGKNEPEKGIAKLGRPKKMAAEQEEAGHGIKHRINARRTRSRSTEGRSHTVSGKRGRGRPRKTDISSSPIAHATCNAKSLLQNRRGCWNKSTSKMTPEGSNPDVDTKTCRDSRIGARVQEPEFEGLSPILSRMSDFSKKPHNSAQMNGQDQSPGKAAPEVRSNIETQEAPTPPSALETVRQDNLRNETVHATSGNQIVCQTDAIESQKRRSLRIRKQTEHYGDIEWPKQREKRPDPLSQDADSDGSQASSAIDRLPSSTHSQVASALDDDAVVQEEATVMKTESDGSDNDRLFVSHGVTATQQRHYVQEAIEAESNCMQQGKDPLGILPEGEEPSVTSFGIVTAGLDLCDVDFEHTTTGSKPGRSIEIVLPSMETISRNNLDPSYYFSDEDEPPLDWPKDSKLDKEPAFSSQSPRSPDGKAVELQTREGSGEPDEASTSDEVRKHPGVSTLDAHHNLELSEELVVTPPQMPPPEKVVGNHEPSSSCPPPQRTPHTVFSEPAVETFNEQPLAHSAQLELEEEVIIPDELPSSPNIAVAQSPPGSPDLSNSPLQRNAQTRETTCLVLRLSGDQEKDKSFANADVNDRVASFSPTAAAHNSGSPPKSTTKSPVPVTPKQTRRTATPTRRQSKHLTSSAKKFALTSLVPDDPADDDELSILTSSPCSSPFFRGKLSRLDNQASPTSTPRKTVRRSTLIIAPCAEDSTPDRMPLTSFRHAPVTESRASRIKTPSHARKHKFGSGVQSSPLARTVAERNLGRDPVATPRRLVRHPSPIEDLVRTPGGTTRRCGDGGFTCERDFCLTCCR